MYHNEKGEGFTGKLATFATFAGVAAVALGSAPTIGRSLGRIGVSLAKDLSEHPNATKSIFGNRVGLDDARNVFSDVFNFIADELPRLDNVIYSGDAHATRMNHMMDALSSQVDEASKDLFHSKRGDISDALHSLVSGVEKENVDKLMSDTLFDRFVKSSQGIQFKFMDQKSANAGEKILDQRKELTKILSNALERAETTRSVSNRTSKQILNSGDNLNVVLDAIHNHVNRLEHIQQRNTKWMGLGEQGIKELTIGDITVGGDAHGGVSEYLKKIGVDHNHHNKAHQALLGFIHDLDFSSVGESAKTDLIDRIHGLSSGLVQDSGGAVFSMAHPMNVLRNSAKRTLENFQIPLVPGAFNIPGNLGKFMIPDPESVKYLGKMGMQGELKRAGALAGLTEDAFGVSIGDRVIAFDGGVAKQLDVTANFVNTSSSEHAKEFARSRGQEVQDLFGSFKDAIDDEGLLKATYNYLKGNDEHSYTVLQKSLFGRQNELFDLSYSEGGFVLNPKENLGKASVAAAMHSIGKMSGIDSSSINPVLMARFLSEGGLDQMPAEAAQDAFRQVFSHAANANVDSSHLLGQVADKLDFSVYGVHGDKIQELLRSSGDPAALLHAIVSDSGGGSLIDNYREISKHISPELSRAIASVGENRDRLLQVGPNSAGLTNKIIEGVVGTDTLSSLHLQVQKGLIAESVRLSGINELTNLSGMGLEETVTALHQNTNPELRRAVAEKLGLRSSSDIGSIIDNLRSTTGNDTYGDIGRLVSPMADFDSLLGMSDNPLIKAKIAEAARADSALNAYYTNNFEAHNRMLKGLSEGAQVSEAVTKRFGIGGTNFVPNEEENIPKFYATVKGQEFGPVDPGFGFLKQVGEYASKMDVGGFIKGLVDPNAPLSHAGFVTNVLMHMPQSVGNSVGLGLTSQEGITVGRSVAGFAIKRVLPAFVALEVYKNYNADMHNMGMPGIDDMAGNAYANFGLTKAKLFDGLGLTAALKTLTSTIPGLDQYGQPHSEEEFNEELFYGDEAVRRGRFFVIGSRTPFTGGAVEYMRPNFYRRMKSHWTEASNVELSNPKYSFLPTLTNPLCLLPDSIVETVSGLKEIKDITTEDYTWNYKNELCKVVATYSRETTEKCRNISVADRAPFPIKCTNTHPIFAVQTNAPTGKPNRKYARELIRYHTDLNKGLQSGLIHPEWVRAENLKIGDLIAYPRAKDIDSITEVDLAEWYPAATSSFVYPRLSKYTAEAWEELSTWDERLLKDFKSIEEHFLWPERTIEKVSRYLRGKRGAPKRLNRFVALDYDLGYVIGLFLAEGSFGGDSYLKYTLNASEVELADFTIATFREKFGVEGSYTIKDNTLYIVIHGQYLVEWFKTFAAGKAVGKSVPPFFLDSPKEFRLGVILGLFEGDGNYDKTKEALAFTSVSKNLINGFNKLLLSLGFRAALNRKGSGGVKRVCGKLCTTNKAWTLVLDKYSTRRLLAGLNGEFDIPFSGDYLFVPITSIDEYEYSGKVYDIQVEKGESFLTPGGIVHNSPINRFLNPAWQEELTEEDRPYMSGNQLHEFLNNQHPGIFFENAPQGGSGPIGYISYGAGLPTTVKAFRGYSGPLGMEGGVSGADGIEGGSMGGTGAGTGSSGANRLGNAAYLPGSDKIRIGNRKDIPVDALETEGLLAHLSTMGEDITRHMGLYGGILRNSPFNSEHEGIESQNPEVAFSNKRFFFGGELGELTGPIGEFYRRFIAEDHQAYDAFNPLPNRMPNWVPLRYRTGDPYMRVSHGEFNLPGDAYERLHPYTRPLKARGSMIGLDKEEIVAKMLDPVGAYESESAEDIMGFGTATHKRIMRQLGLSGYLEGAEVAGYDPEHNISATIETIVRGKTGLEVVEIKTRGNETFNTDPDKYIDQLMFYMYLTGSKQGHIAHVNRDNPSQVRFATYKYDPERMQGIFDKVEEARNEVREMVEQGIVSPYETYDLLSRIEILAKTAPDSSEFRDYVQHAQTKGGFGGMEQVRFERAIRQAQVLREDFNLYPYRNVPTETRHLKVKDFTDNGEIVTNMGVIKLAGVKFDRQAFTMQDPADIFGEFGIQVGRGIDVTLPEGNFNEEIMADVTSSALIGNVNSRLIHSQYADPDYADKSAMASVARQDKLFGGLEKLLHSDNVISNKWLRVRSGLEQFERGEVYGTENQSYRDLWGNYVVPTFNLIVSKNPLAAAIQGGVVTSFFVKGKEAKGKAALIGGAVAGLISMGRMAHQAITGDTLVPARYREQTEFDEYYDLLNYVKQASLAQNMRNHGYKNNRSEGIQMDYSNVSRTREQVDAFGVLALEAERKARQTMYGFDVVTGTLQDALSAIPKRHRQIAESVIVNGTQDERAKFYNLLPNSERRVLGKFLGKNKANLPERPRLQSYFSNHFLPDADWLGWHRETDLEDIKVRAAELEHMKVDQPSRSRVSKARAYTRNIPVPKMHSSSYHSVRSVVDRLSASGAAGNTRFTTSFLPSNQSSVVVNMKFLDQNTQKHDESLNSIL